MRKPLFDNIRLKTISEMDKIRLKTISEMDKIRLKTNSDMDKIILNFCIGWTTSNCIWAQYV